MQKVQDFSIQLKEKEDELERKEAKINHLRSIVQTQEYTKDDIHKLEYEKANIEEKIKQIRKLKEENENVTLQKALSVKKMFDELQKIAQMFNDKISIMFPDEKEASSYMISVKKELAQDQDQSIFLGGVDIKGTLMPRWMNEKQIYDEKKSQLQCESFDLTEKMQEGEDAISDINRDIEVSHSLLDTTVHGLRIHIVQHSLNIHCLNFVDDCPS